MPSLPKIQSLSLILPWTCYPELANLLEANLPEANLLEANLLEANLLEANVLEANLSKAILLKPKRFLHRTASALEH